MTVIFFHFSCQNGRRAARVAARINDGNFMEKSSSAFFWRRLHSLTGLFLVLFLLEHLLTNSQAALFFGDDGAGFVHMVNGIHNLPYLPAIEVFLLGMPILVHAVWGVKYLMTSEPNSWGSQGEKAALGMYPRNRAYTFQRITSWILLVGIALHVYQMRWQNYPVSTGSGTQSHYMVPLSFDKGLYTVANRLYVDIYDTKKIASMEESFNGQLGNLPEELSLDNFFHLPKEVRYDSHEATTLLNEQKYQRFKEWVETLKANPISETEVIAVSNNFGTATLLVVRDTFKEPAMLILYSIFVISATFHGFNGLWTFLITWGITLNPRSQQLAKKMTLGLMGLLTFMGLSAIWGTYWITLRF